MSSLSPVRLRKLRLLGSRWVTGQESCRDVRGPVVFTRLLPAPGPGWGGGGTGNRGLAGQVHSLGRSLARPPGHPPGRRGLCPGTGTPQEKRKRPACLALTRPRGGGSFLKGWMERSGPGRLGTREGAGGQAIPTKSKDSTSHVCQALSIIILIVIIVTFRE